MKTIEDRRVEAFEKSSMYEDCPQPKKGTPVIVWRREDLDSAKRGDCSKGFLGFIHTQLTKTNFEVFLPHQSTIMGNIRFKDDPIAEFLPTEWGFWDYTDDVKLTHECAKKLGLIKPVKKEESKE